MTEGLQERIADLRFKIVLALIGGIDGPEAGAHRKLGELRGALFLPRRPVDQIRDRARYQ